MNILHYKKQVSYGAMALIVLYLCVKVLTAVYLSALPPEDARVYEATVQAELLEVSVTTIVWCGVIILFPLTALVLAIAHTTITLRIRVKLASVHPFEVCGSKILVHERDLQIAAPIAMGIVNGEQLKQANAGLDTALQLAGQIQTWQERQMKLLAAGASPVAAPAIVAAPDIHTQDAPVVIPTFSDLLTTGLIAPGKPLVIGFAQDGVPVRSDLGDNYSTVVIGESGTGKTTGEAYSIAQTMLAYGARYTILDPHFPDKKHESLGDRLGALKRLPCVTIHNNPFALDAVVAELDDEFETYKRDGIGQTPHILVVDEHALWKNSTNGGKDLLKFEEKIIYEGRKYDWYLHVTSKSPLAQDFGTSAVRDNFVTSLLYRTKKHQSQTFFKDSSLVELAQTCDKPGMAVYTNRAGKSAVVTVPYIATQDMQQVVALIGNGDPIIMRNSLETPVSIGETSMIQEQLTRYLQTSHISQNELADRLHLSRKEMSFYRNDKPLSPGKKRAIEAQLLTVFRDGGNSETPDSIGETRNAVSGNVVALETRRTS